jgi:hypothetical protein
MFSIASSTARLAALARGKLLEAFQHSRNDRLSGRQHEHALGAPLGVEDAVGPALERVGAKVERAGDAQRYQRLTPDFETLLPLSLNTSLKRPNLIAIRPPPSTR